MKEKKLTDEEVIKGLEWCCYKASKQGCVGCAYCETVNDDIRCSMKKMLCDTLDLIRRLQEENEQLRNAKVITETVDYCAEDLKKAQDEIERLTEENGYLDGCAKQFLADYQKCEIERAELQKQMDELKNKCCEISFERYEEGKYDTAKEILQGVEDCINGMLDGERYMTKNEVEYLLEYILNKKYDYGVEVE